jgi:hypothetical protein
LPLVASTPGYRHPDRPERYQTPARRRAGPAAGQVAEGVMARQPILKAQKCPKKLLPNGGKPGKVHTAPGAADQGRRCDHRHVQKGMALRVP